MESTKIVQIDAKTLETLKRAAWLWKCEGQGDYHELRTIEDACHKAQAILTK